MRLSWLEVQNINKRDRSVRKEKYLKRIKFGDNEKDSHIVGGGQTNEQAVSEEVGENSVPLLTWAATP